MFVDHLAERSSARTEEGHAHGDNCYYCGVGLVRRHERAYANDAMDACESCMDSADLRARRNAFRHLERAL